MPGLKNRAKKALIQRVSLTLFFCLFTTLAFAAKPTVGTLSPTSGSTAANTAKVFTTTYSDADGWTNLKEVYLLISTSSSALSKSIYLYYNQNTNKLYLSNDTNTSWLGGYTPASIKTIENSQVKLNCKATTASGSAKTLTLKWEITFKTAYSGKAYNIYLKAVDDNAGVANWTQKGTFTVNSTPTLGTVNPSSGTSSININQVFTATYSDSDGWQNIQEASFLVNTSTSGSNCLYAYYNQNTNKLYLRNDANSAWLGGYAPGASNVIENSYAKLLCASTTVSGKDNTLTIKWSIIFKSNFTGAKKIYLYVKDDANAYTNWSQKGTITIQTPDLTAPTGSIQINNADYTNSLSVTLTLSATDSGSGMGTGAQMKFSNDNSNWSTPENYATSKTWPLTSGDGTKTVYVKFKDVAGNWSGAFSDTITLDTKPPTISINPINTAVNQNVTLTYTVTDNFTPANAIIVTGDNSPYVTEGSHNVTLTARDLAGNSATKSISFTIDKTAPVVIITSPQNGAILEDPQVQLQGTIDGVAFSETRTLQNQGENTLTKTATDLAGNSSSASITVYLYSGTPIGPEGGEAISLDKRVKIIIPPGALDKIENIIILPIDIETFNAQIPSGRTLLSVVECRPYNLPFNKCVTLIYTLSQAEIPGTPVELGYYNSTYNEIRRSGQTSVVPADGYTLTFLLTHFSTYGALKSFISQGAPIGAGVKIPLPDMLTGAFSHSIPITLPPGRKGMQPTLALNYRSSNPNSWTGLGFSLNPGYIVRSTRLGPPTYKDTQDTFYFITDAGTTELVHLVDNLYQAKVESSFAKFFKESDDSWRVAGKDGGTLRFGQTSDSKETSSQGTFSWYLTKAIDTNGNYIEYRYFKDEGNKCYLSRIDYTGNEAGISPTNSVEFFLESRTDKTSSYISGTKIATNQRLKEIRVNVKSDLVWSYLLEYEYSPDTNRSLLRSITQSGSDRKNLPVQKFSYQKAK